jgi:hypothetical protein
VTPKIQNLSSSTPRTGPELQRKKEEFLMLEQMKIIQKHQEEFSGGNKFWETPFITPIINPDADSLKLAAALKLKREAIESKLESDNQIDMDVEKSNSTHMGYEIETSSKPNNNLQ